MSLENSIKADEEALAKLQAGETEEVKEEVKEETVEETVEEVKVEPKEEPAKDEAPKIDNAAYAKMRIDKAAAEQKARELEARLAALEKAKQEPVEEAEEVETQTIELPPEVQDLVYRQKIDAAKNHLEQIEQEFLGSGQVTDYQEYINGYTLAVARSIAVLNPNLSPNQIRDEVERRILTEAAGYHKAGKNAAEEMYNRAKSMGLKYEEPKAAEEEKPRSPNLDRVAENKKRSAGMASAGGSSNEITTLKAAIDMPLSQFASIPALELERLERGGR